MHSTTRAGPRAFEDMTKGRATCATVLYHGILPVGRVVRFDSDPVSKYVHSGELWVDAAAVWKDLGGCKGT